MTTVEHHEPVVASDPPVPPVPLNPVTREFDAPPDKVFRVHADPELLVQWLGPRELTIDIDLDCRSGGSYRCESLDEVLVR